MVSKERTIDCETLRVFVAIASRKGITAAADALGMTKSGVSKRLSSLEQLLETRLFERTSRRVSLTREGQALLGRAESILADLDRFVTDAQEEQPQARGTVRIAASPEFGALLSECFLPPLLQRYPELKVVVSLDYGFDDLHDPSVDLAFRLGSWGDSRLVARQLGDISRALVCSVRYAQSIVLQTPHDLERANVLLFSDRQSSGEWLLEEVSSPAQPCKVRVSGNVAVRGMAALANAAIAGLGVAQIPLFVAAPALADGRLIRVLPQWQFPLLPVYLAYRSGVSRVGRVRAVIDAAVEIIPRLLAQIAKEADPRSS